jgi:hypothetical protein
MVLVVDPIQGVHVPPVPYSRYGAGEEVRVTSMCKGGILRGSTTRAVTSSEPSYMTGVLRLILLASGSIATLVEGWEGAKVTVAKLMVPCPVE